MFFVKTAQGIQKTRIAGNFSGDVKSTVKEIVWNSNGYIHKLPQIDNLVCNLDGASFTRKSNPITHEYIPESVYPTINLPVHDMVEPQTTSLELDGSTDPLHIELQQPTTNQSTFHCCVRLVDIQNASNIVTFSNGVRVTLSNASTPVLSLSVPGTLTNNLITQCNLANRNKWFDIVLIFNSNRISFIVNGIWRGAVNTTADLSYTGVKFNTNDYTTHTQGVGTIYLRTCRIWKHTFDLNESYYTMSFLSPDKHILPATSHLLTNWDMLTAPHARSLLLPQEQWGYFMKGTSSLKDSMPTGKVAFDSFNSGNTSSHGLCNDYLAHFIGRDHKAANNFISWKIPNITTAFTHMTISIYYRATQLNTYRGDWGLYNSKLRCENVGATDKRIYAGSLTNSNFSPNVNLTLSSNNSGYNVVTYVIDNSTLGRTGVKAYVNGELQRSGSFNGNLPLEDRIYFSCKIDSATEIYIGSNIFLKSIRVWDTALTDEQVRAAYKYDKRLNFSI